MLKKNTAQRNETASKQTEHSEKLQKKAAVNWTHTKYRRKSTSSCSGKTKNRKRTHNFQGNCKHTAVVVIGIVSDSDRIRLCFTWTTENDNPFPTAPALVCRPGRVAYVRYQANGFTACSGCSMFYHVCWVKLTLFVLLLLFRVY